MNQEEEWQESMRRLVELLKDPTQEELDACWRFMESLQDSEISPDEWAQTIRAPRKHWRDK
jgi:hypothetical protein